MAFKRHNFSSCEWAYDDKMWKIDVYHFMDCKKHRDNWIIYSFRARSYYDMDISTGNLRSMYQLHEQHPQHHYQINCHTSQLNHHTTHSNHHESINMKNIIQRRIYIITNRYSLNTTITLIREAWNFNRLHSKVSEPYRFNEWNSSFFVYLNCARSTFFSSFLKAHASEQIELSWGIICLILQFINSTCDHSLASTKNCSCFNWRSQLFSSIIMLFLALVSDFIFREFFANKIQTS